jgi:aryl carrier-like protein
LIALIINVHQFERDGIDVEFVSLYRTSVLARPNSRIEQALK